jgi:hypothetical protein
VVRRMQWVFHGLRGRSKLKALLMNQDGAKTKDQKQVGDRKRLHILEVPSVRYILP